MNKYLRALLLAVLIGSATLTAMPVLAQEEPAAAPAAPVPWSSLSGEQQKLLGSFGSQWNSLPPERQQALAHGSQRWLSMSPTEQGAARERFGRWQALPPAQRQALRSRWQHFQSLSPSQQQAVRDNFHRFQQMPPAQRQALQERWRSATPQQRLQMVERAREHRQPAHAAPHSSPPPRPHH
jgi:hypothetical protein